MARLFSSYEAERLPKNHREYLPNSLYSVFQFEEYDIISLLKNANTFYKQGQRFHAA